MTIWDVFFWVAIGLGCLAGMLALIALVGCFLPRYHVAARTLTTLHGRLDVKDLPECYRRWPKYPLVAISNYTSQYPGSRDTSHGLDLCSARFRSRNAITSSHSR